MNMQLDVPSKDLAVRECLAPLSLQFTFLKGVPKGGKAGKLRLLKHVLLLNYMPLAY